MHEHPEWFTTRADGTIAYAENPPKKYQDIYPLNFDNDPAGIYAEVRRVVQVWIDHGVTLFRVDNPHTKPVEFWQWLIADVAKDHPEVIWLAEAFTRPAMMHDAGQGRLPAELHLLRLAQPAVGAARSTCRELAGDAPHYMRPSFWPTTHDILTPYMQFGGPAAWKLRAALAATLVPTYGIYAGYELMEHVPRPGVEEQIDNEKYEFKDRHWARLRAAAAEGRPAVDGRLPDARSTRSGATHPALHWLRNLALPPRRRRERPRVLQAPRSPDGTRRHDHRGRQPRPARDPGDLACTSTCRRSGSTGATASSPTT